MFISTRHMTGVTVDAATRTATVQAGAKMGAVLEAAAPHGLGPLSGSSPLVGVVGFLAGGGLPLIGRKYGYGVENVKSFELVTVDGRKRRCSPTQEADLFWAVRGGKGNFGVVTSIDLELVNQPTLYGGSLFFQAGQIKDVMTAYLDWIKNVPEEMCTSIAIYHGIPAPPCGGDAKAFLHVRVAHTGSAAEGQTLLEPLRALTPFIDNVKELPYKDLGTIHNDPPQPAISLHRSVLTRQVDPEVIDQFIAFVGTGEGLPAGAIELRHLGGALGRERVPSAVGHHDATMFFFTGMHVGPPQVEDAKQKQAQLIGMVEPYSTGGIVPSFLGYADTSAEQVRAAYDRTDYYRLRQIKSRVDPRNRMRINYNIPPL
jgi:FAD/FMN-containing dehydrogenase